MTPAEKGWAVLVSGVVGIFLTITGISYYLDSQKVDEQSTVEAEKAEESAVSEDAHTTQTGDIVPSVDEDGNPKPLTEEEFDKLKNDLSEKCPCGAPECTCIRVNGRCICAQVGPCHPACTCAKSQASKDPNLVYHNKQWWYYNTSKKTWKVHDGKEWKDYNSPKASSNQRNYSRNQLNWFGNPKLRYRH